MTAQERVKQERIVAVCAGVEVEVSSCVNSVAAAEDGFTGFDPYSLKAYVQVDAGLGKFLSVRFTSAARRSA